jgi:hypothetical protein
MAVTTEMVIFVLAIITAIAALWWRVEAAIAAAKAEALKATETAKEDALKAVKDAKLLADAAQALASFMGTQLAEHKLHVAETYITKAGLRETTEQIMGAIGEVKASMVGLNSRIDQIIVERPRPRTTRKT